MGATIKLHSGDRYYFDRFPIKDTYTMEESDSILGKISCEFANSIGTKWHEVLSVAINHVIDYTPDLMRGNRTQYSRGGDLYIVKSESGLYKIGRSVDPKNRKHKIKQDTGLKVEIIKIIPGKYKDEIFWHRYFKNKKAIFCDINGHKCREWFYLNDDDLSAVFNKYG